VSPTPVAVAALDARLDPASATPRAVISWEAVSLPNLVGLNLYRDLVSNAGDAILSGRRVNRDLLPPGVVSAIDDSLTAGVPHRYRLEAFFADGSSLKVAEGLLAVSASPLVGRPYPNPFRPRTGATASLSYRLPASADGATLTLRVFSAAGGLLREVRAPAAPIAGFGVVTWDGRDAQGKAAPSGVYYLRLTGAGLDDSRGIVLVR
jgi:hypothetical protein